MSRKVIIMPDSFKGSMTSAEVASIIGKEAKLAGWETEEIPIADGGEGSIECILSVLGGERVATTVYGPDGNLRSAFYGVTNDKTAVLEIAESTGITKQNSLNPMTSDTFGFGQMISDALEKGLRKFFICLGGSASTDCGLGMAAALGAKFYDKEGKEFIPCGGRLKEVAGIDISNLDPRISESSFRVMSDVESPLYGEKGAAYVFSPQKGASPSEVKILDDGLRHVAPLIMEATNTPFERVKGAGAAGGSGYGCVAFLKAEIASGIESILDLVDFDSRVKDADLVITGEGKLDSQSLMGKVLSGIKKRTADIPIVSFCGICDADTEELKILNVTAVEIGRGIHIDESMRRGPENLKKAAKQFFSYTEG